MFHPARTVREWSGPRRGGVGEGGVAGETLVVVVLLDVLGGLGGLGGDSGGGVVGAGLDGLAEGLGGVAEGEVCGGGEDALDDVEVDCGAGTELGLAVLGVVGVLDELGVALGGGAGPCPVGVSRHGHGVHLVGDLTYDRGGGGAVVPVVGGLAGLAVHQVGGLGDAEPGLDFDRPLCHEVELVVLLLADLVLAVLLEEAAGDVVGGLVGAAGGREVVLVADPVFLVEEVVPVGVAEVFVVAVGVEAVGGCGGVAVAAAELLVPVAGEGEHAVDGGRIRALGVGVGLEEVGGPVVAVGDEPGDDGPAVDAEGAVVGDPGGAGRRGLGGHQDDAEGPARAVDGGGGGVLEDGDGFDVGGIDGVHGGLDPVQEDECAAAGPDGVLGAADADSGVAGGLAVGEGQGEAGDRALEGAGDSDGGAQAGVDVLGGEGLDGPDYVAAFLDAVSDHDDLVEARAVLLHHDVDEGLAVELDFLGLVAETGEFELFGPSGIEGIGAVAGGACAAHCPGNHDDDPGHGISVHVGDCSGDGAAGLG